MLSPLREPIRPVAKMLLGDSDVDRVRETLRDSSAKGLVDGLKLLPDLIKEEGSQFLGGLNPIGPKALQYESVAFDDPWSHCEFNGPQEQPRGEQFLAIDRREKSLERMTIA